MPPKISRQSRHNLSTINQPIYHVIKLLRRQGKLSYIQLSHAFVSVGASPATTSCLRIAGDFLTLRMLLWFGIGMYNEASSPERLTMKFRSRGYSGVRGRRSFLVLREHLPNPWMVLHTSQAFTFFSLLFFIIQFFSLHQPRFPCRLN